MKKILFTLALIVSLGTASFDVYAQDADAIKAKATECKGYTYNSRQWNNNGCADPYVHGAVCDSFAVKYAYWADFVGTPEYKQFACEMVDNGRYINDKPPASANCSTITATNYNTCCTAGPNTFQSGFAYEPSDACKAYSQSTSGTTAVTVSNACTLYRAPQKEFYDAGCDKPFLIQMGQLDAMCRTLPIGSVRWNNLGCTNLTSNTAGSTGLTGAGAPPTGPQNAASTGKSFASSTVSDAKELQACSDIKFKSLLDILIWIKCIIVAAIIPLIFVLAFLFFLWGVLRFMMASDQKNKDESKKMMWWGMVGLFVMVSVWGIIKIVGNVLGIESGIPFLQTEYLKK